MVDDECGVQISAPERFSLAGLNELVQELAAKYRVFVPMDRDGYIEFREYEPGANIAWDFQNSTKSPKSVIFPQTEEMFKYSYGKEAEDFNISGPALPDKPVAIVGIRPCDVHAFTKVDHNFKGDFIDPYYIARRKNTSLIGLACNDPCFNCFCTSMGGGPHSRDCMDAMIINAGDNYIFEILSMKGKELSDGVKELLTDAPEGIGSQLDDLQNAAEEKIVRKIDLNELDLSGVDIFEDPVWEGIAERCIGCGICVFVCPTCRCFDVQEEVTSKHGRRLRIWDTCQYPEYTVHGSGYNPRPARTHRVRNRLMCRLKYTVDKFGVHYCTGCGRCTASCPVNIDIFENFELIRERIRSKKGEKDRAETCAPGTRSSEVKN